MVDFTSAADLTDWDALSDDTLFAMAEQRARQGLAPPARIYRIEYRHRIDWSRFPEWARPVDPEMFDGCGHEG